jgi:hypothetical protein
LAEILEARKRRESLAEIGVQLGITRERVRQILRDANLSPEERVQVTGKLKKCTREPREPRKLTTVLVNRWLAEIGYRYCSYQHHAVPMAEVCRGRMGTCKRCAADYSSKRYHAHHERQLKYCREYRKAHPDVQRRASRKWWRKHHPNKAVGAFPATRDS